MDFTKMHGAANDFVVVDARNVKRNWPVLAKTVCDRHRSIGCDSLITLLPSDKANFGMRTYDADGSESETCGNGLRCLARYVLEKGLVKQDVEEITIETLSAVSNIRLQRENGELKNILANLGKPRLDAPEIPVNPGIEKEKFSKIGGMIVYKDNILGMELSLNLVSMGNPHAVFFTGEPVKNFPMSEISPAVENLRIFPNRINFEVARVLDKGNIEARVWERGVGETQACGSGTCAITAASSLNGFTGPKVKVHFPGGTLDAELNGSGEVVLGGPAVIVYEGIWPDRSEDENRPENRRTETILVC